MSKLMPLVEKEVKDLLRDPRIYIGLIIPIIMLPLMGFVISTAMTSTMETATKEVDVALLDYDGSEASKELAVMLSMVGFNISYISSNNIEDAVNEARALGSEALLVIPSGFSDNLLNFGKVKIYVYAIIERVGMGSIGVYSAIDNTLKKMSEILSDKLISKLAPQVEPEAVRDPLNVTGYTVIKDRVIEAPPEALFSQLLVGYGIMVPIVLMVLAITVTQISATATAVENEEKTLETLLTFPVSRYKILLAKLIGSSIVALIGGLVFTAGFFLYYQGIFTMAGLAGGAVNLTQNLPPPPAGAYVVLAVSMILSILFITSLGVVIGALSSDVRMASSLLGIVIIPIVIPSLLIMYGDVGALPLPLRLLVYALPTSYPMIVAREMITSTIPIEAIYGIPYSAALTLIVMYITSKLFAPEKLLTLQYKLRLRRKRRVEGLE